ncbi:MAG: hypothetical protein KIT79_11670 [Deltaproteobacteria bacterium]|nr:hypothetical protein [Deltaproteobacteria bacterium]
MKFKPFHVHAHYVDIDPSVRIEPVRFHAPDGFPLNGLLHLPAKNTPEVAVLAMHPRGDFSRHYLAPGLVNGGYAFLGANSRHLNNDADALHERLLIDVAGSIRFLKDRGFKKIILAGNSGGGSLFAFYIQQSGLPPDQRFDSGPSGDKVPLREVELPPVDGFIILAAHPGEGRFLMDRLDPSVVDETSPTACNPRLDMYNPKNGYRPMHEGPSKYSPDFLAEYRAAQRQRCERIDRLCKEWSAESLYYRARLKDPARLTPAEMLMASRHGLQRRYLVIYRTLADPRYLDPAIDPNRRPIGSLFAQGGRDPIAGNYGEGLSRVMSARGWLSTWSGLESRAALELTAPSIRIPTHMVYADADTEIYERECRAAYGLIPATDKTFTTMEWADHYLFPVGSEGQSRGNARQKLCEDALLPWLKQRWPV